MAAILHTVRVLDARAHLFEVTLRIAHPSKGQVVRMPVWIPGSYLVREFPRHVHALHARQVRRAVEVHAIDKSTWRIDCRAKVPLTLRYQVLAFDASVRAAWLDTQRGFFNGSSLFMQVDGQTQRPQDLVVEAPQQGNWQLATAMPAVRVDARGFGRYRAEHYDALIDAPVEMGVFWSASMAWNRGLRLGSRSGCSSSTSFSKGRS